jgi:hypothetical protein
MTLDLFGVMIGPALIAGIHQIDVDIGWFHFNEQTAPGYIMAVLQLFMFFMFLFNFVEPPPQKRRVSIRRRSLETTTGLDEAGQAKEAASWRTIARVMFTGGGWYCILTVFTINFNLCALETVATPLMEDNFGW